MSTTTPDTTSETTAPASPATVAEQTKKTTTVSEESTTTTGPAKAGSPSNKPRGARSASTTPTTASTPPAKSPSDKTPQPSAAEVHRQRVAELQGIIRQFSDYPQFKDKVNQIHEVLKNIDADADNPYLTPVHASQLESIDAALLSMGTEVAKIPALETKINRVDGEVTLLRHDHNELHDRFEDATRIPGGHFFIAAAVGLIAGVVAWFTMLGRNTLADGTVVDIPQIWIVAILVGLALFALTLGILSMFRSRKSKETQEVRAVPAVPVNHQPIEPVPVAPATQTAPTKVLVTEGAHSGAR